MNRVTMSGSDGFWARVRTALGGGKIAEPAYGHAEIATTPNGKPKPARVNDELRQGWDVAAHRKVSLCVMALEIDRYAEYVTAYGRDAADDCIETLFATISGLLTHDSHRCIRSGRAGLTLVLPDMPVLMARELARKIAIAVRRQGLSNRESHAGHVTLGIGLAVINPHGKVDRLVTTAAEKALRKAQKRGLARLEVADLRTHEDATRKAA